MSAAGFQQLKRELTELLDSVSSHGFALGVDFISGVPGEIISTWPEEWLLDYQKNDYILYDPVVIWGALNDGIMNWNELLPIFQSLPVNVIEKAREFGIPNGSVFSFSFNRRKTVLGISHREASLPESIQNEILGQLSVYTFRSPKAPQVDLSEKSLDYLSQAARGLTDREIAESRQVSVGAVHQLRRRTLSALDASTVPEAVLKAYKSQLID